MSVTQTMSTGRSVRLQLLPDQFRVARIVFKVQHSDHLAPVTFRAQKRPSVGVPYLKLAVCAPPHGNHGKRAWTDPGERVPISMLCLRCRD